MERLIKKSEILTKYFGIYGRGNFDLSHEEIAHVIEILKTKEDDQYLDANLCLLYERLSKARLG